MITPQPILHVIPVRCTPQDLVGLAMQAAAARKGHNRDAFARIEVGTGVAVEFALDYDRALIEDRIPENIGKSGDAHGRT